MFIISRVNNTEPLKNNVKDLNKKGVSGSFYVYDLKKTIKKEINFHIDKLLKTKIRKLVLDVER